MASLLSAHDQLNQAWQSLQREWQASREEWDDPVSQRFEREFWQEYERVTSATIAEIQKLAEVIALARRAVR